MPVNPVPEVLLASALIVLIVGTAMYRRRRAHARRVLMAGIALLSVFLGTYFVPVWVMALKARSAQEQFLVGEAYKKRASCSFPNQSAAARWYERAAAAGHAQAQFEIGIAYLYGWGVKQDKKAAFAWFEKAAANGNRAARPYVEQLSAEFTVKFGGDKERWNVP